MFKRKKALLPLTIEQVAAKNAKQQAEDAVRNNAIEWIYNSPNSVFSEIFAKMMEDVVSLGGDTLSSLMYEEEKKAYRGAIHKLESISTTWFQIDRHALSRNEALKMYNYINGTLINLVRSFVRTASTHGISQAYDYYGGPRLVDSFSKCFVEIYSIRTNQETQLNSTEILGRPKAVGISTGTSAANVFPKIQTSNKELNTTLLHLEDLWVEASSKKNSIEDEYILEEIAHSYLPDAAKLYSTFKLAKPEYQQQAELIILEQIKLLETRIQAILDSSFEAALLALSTQTEFLKTKVPDETETFKVGTII